MIRANASLKARIERLEQRKLRRPLPRICFYAHGRADDEVIGYQAANGLSIMRIAQEPLAALAERSWALTTGAVLAALYGPSEADCEPTAEPSPVALPVEPEPDPYAVGQPGVGAIASPKLLESMGAIPVQPERLI